MSATQFAKHIARVMGGAVLLLLIPAISSRAEAPSLSLAETKKIFQKSAVFIAVEYETEGADGAPEAGCKTGTGVLISSSGFVITSEHLLRDKRGTRYPKMFITGSVGASFDCSRKTGNIREITPVSSSGENDVALLKFVVPDVFEPVRVCRQTRIDDGEDLYVLGFPLGRQLTPQAVTKSNESGPWGLWTIQGSLNSGNSGGPVFSKFGRLVGIVKGSVGNASGIGYLVPTNLFLDRLQAGGGTVQDCITLSGPADAQRCKPVVRTIPVDFVMDDHSSLEAKTKSFSQTYPADPGLKIRSWNWNVTSSTKASGADIVPMDEGRAIRISTTLTSGPIYDRWRGWLEGRLELIQVPPDCIGQ